jgi:iron only hydrogenase large subunit-like protein
MACSQIADVIHRLKSERPMVALTAPALTGIFPNPRRQLNGALKKLGFKAVYDVAAGADRTAACEAAELSHKLAEGQPFMLTSCCPAWVETVTRHLPELQPYLSDTPSPMQISAQAAHETHPDAAIVFIGPCAAKRSEAIRSATPDFVLTAEELAALLMARDIDVTECEESPFEEEGSSAGIGFASSGGVAAAVQKLLPESAECKSFRIDGLTRKSINLLKAFALKKSAPAPLIEVMCCEGGCTSGPCSFEDPTRAAQRIAALCSQ